MARLLRISDRPRETVKSRVAFTLFRFAVYGVLGIALEVLFYTLVRVGRQVPVIDYLFAFEWQVDPRLGLDGPWHTPLVTMFGQSSLWMLPVYALPALTIEFAYRRWLFMRSWVFRAPVYGVIILFFEWWTGLAAKWVTGYAIWMYTDRGNIMEMTSLFIWPMWMVAGMLIEVIYRELMDPKLRAALEASISG
jgi:hypothetical protein